MPGLGEELHPRQFRWLIVATALVAMLTWWGLGLPYSLYSWLLDGTQLRWVLVCYAWEVPVAGGLGPVLFGLLGYRDIERRWEQTFRDPVTVDAAAASDLERAILDFPIRLTWVLLLTSVVGYAVGAFQLRLFAQTPVTELVKVGALGVATGLIGGLFAFLYLETLLAPLLQRLGTLGAVPRAGRRVPLYVKVFACSLIVTVAALLLLGTIAYTRGERVLEEELGARLLAGVRGIAEDFPPERGKDLEWWRHHEEQLRLGPSGYAYIIDGKGTVVGGTPRVPRLADESFRPAAVQTILTASEGDLVDRVYVPRVLAFARLRGTPLRVVAVAARSDFAAELDTMLRRGGAVFLLGMGLALIQALLFSRRLTRPIETLTNMASAIARTPSGRWEIVPVRTNDEVGELATAFNQMITRLKAAREDLERRVAEATRNITTLYEVARTTTSTLEIEDVLKLVAEKTLAALGFSRLVVLWHTPDEGELVDAYLARGDGREQRLEIDRPLDLAPLCPGTWLPAVTPASTLAPALPPTVAAELAAPRLLSMPLVFKERLLGVILAAIEGEGGEPDLELAAALANQAAAALANAALFETVRRNEVDLRKLSHMRAQLQEESLRTISRELHDGFAQVLTAINMDLGQLERTGELDALAWRTRVHDVREQMTALLQDVRTMSQVLRPSMLDFGLVPTIHWFVEKFMARTDLRVDVRTPPEETRLPPPIELLLYRVVQEALNNTAKHASAGHASLELRVAAHEAVLTVTDDGVGFDAERQRRTRAVTGVGLLGMRERVAYYRGHLEIRSRPRAGTRITVTVPLDTVTDEETPYRSPTSSAPSADS